MAFNFSRSTIDPATRAENQEKLRRDLSDRKFSGKTLREIEIALSADSRSSMTEDLTVFGVADRGPLEFEFDSLRFETHDLRALRDTLNRALSKRLDAGETVAERQGLLSARAFGAFRKRSWRDHAGRVHERWTFVVARLRYAGEGGEAIEIGWTPAS